MTTQETIRRLTDKVVRYVRGKYARLESFSREDAGWMIRDTLRYSPSWDWYEKQGVTGMHYDCVGNRITLRIEMASGRTEGIPIAHCMKYKLKTIRHGQEQRPGGRNPLQ